MIRLFRIFLIALLAIAGSIEGFAKEWGDDVTSQPYRYRVEGPKKLNVRRTPEMKGTVVVQLRSGDYAYITDISYGGADNRDWGYIPNYGYVPMPRPGIDKTQLYQEENPNYINPEPAKNTQSLEMAVETSHFYGKWGWIILFLGAMGIGIYSLAVRLQTRYPDDGADTRWDWLRGTTNNGMRKQFFFNKRPYIFILEVTVLLACAALSALVCLLAIGGTVWLVLWIVKIVSLIVLWIGIIGCVLGIIGLVLGILGGGGSMAGGSIVAIVVGGFIWAYKREIEGFADACSDTGLAFMSELNILAFAQQMVIDYWKPTLIVIALPLAIFLSMAILWYMFAGTLILIEKFQTRRYNINHKCPHCGETSEPAVYLSEGMYPFPDNIKLRPGAYGLFHITHPDTGESMSTMLSNGRDQYVRRCANCGSYIQAEEGTEKKIVMVGAPQSGKSTFIYRFIAELMRRDNNVRFTDEQFAMTDGEEVLRKIQMIRDQGEITRASEPNKTTEEEMASTQLIVPRASSTIPYRLYINDVAGETFVNLTNSTLNKDVVENRGFMRNVENIIFIYDPFTTHTESEDPHFLEWCEKNKKHIVHNRSLSMDNLKSSVVNLFDESAISRKNLNINIVLTKIDTGYVPDHALENAETLKNYACDALNLQNMFQWMDVASVNIFAVSAMAKNEASGMSQMTDTLLKQLDIRM